MLWMEPVCSSAPGTMALQRVLLLLLLLLLALCTCDHAESPAELDESISLTEIYVYQDTEFIFFSEKVTWAESNLICPTYKARLAVIDEVNKAKFIAESIAYSNLGPELQFLWVGARFGPLHWEWVPTKTFLPGESDSRGFPPWQRQFRRPGKDCVAVSRKGHNTPLFTDRECRLLHPFICEKSVGVDLEKPMPTIRGMVGQTSYTLFHGRVTWQQAVAGCRTEGMRIAIVRNNLLADELAALMLRSRPDMENAWIGAIALHSKWQWITTGEILPSVTGSDEYPPWMLKSSREDTGCVLLDRHKCDYTVFVDISCDRKRSFVCEHTVNLEVDSPQEVEVKLPNRTVVIYTIKKTWIAASRFCISKGARLIILPNMEDIDALMDGMADHPNEVKHVWVGGELRDSSWVWAATGEAIPDGFSAWSSEPVSPSRSCLNLDRQAYTRPLLYGLHCNVSQPFVCESDPGVGHSTVEPSNTTSNTTTKKDFEEYDVHILRDLGNIDEMTTATSHILSTSTTTPKQYPKGAVCKAFVPHGEWVDCKPSPNGMLECSLYCDGLFFSVFGSREVNCSYEDEEVIGYRNLTTRPQCMHEAQLVKYLHFRLHHLHTETKLADSILFLVDGNYVAYARTVEFLKAIIRTIPVNTQFPAGMISYAGPQYMMRLNGTEVCQVKRRMLQMAEERHNDGVVDIGKAFLLARNEILDFQRKHCIIILCWNGTRDVPDPESYRETIADLKSKGHYIFGVSEEMDTNRQLEPFVTENEEKKELDLFVFHTIEQYTLWLNFKEHEIDPLRKC